MVPVGNVPLRQFEGNVAAASGRALETWFSLRNIKDQSRRTVIDGLMAWGLNGTGIFSPYTNNITYKNVTLIGNLNNPTGTAFARNDVTANAVYDHVDARGWSIAINVPVNGKFNQVVAGRFDNLKNILITTANGDRVININDAGPNDRIQFLDTYAGKTQSDVYLQSNFNPREQDITKLFSKDVIQMGTVRYNGVQLYYLEQAADYVPFRSSDPATPDYIPTALRDKTNQQLFNQYGLAIGGVVAPADAKVDPKINGLIGAKAAYPPELVLTSAKYAKFTVGTPSYILSYKYWDAATNKYKTIKETTKTQLSPGWNLLTRTVAGMPRTLLVYGDITAPTFAFAAGTPTTVNRADIDRGASLLVQGKILDDSFGSKNFRQSFALNDSEHVSDIHTDESGLEVVTLSFKIKDNAGNTWLVTYDLNVTDTATLTKDIGRKDLPTIKPSITLIALVKRA